MTHAWDIVAYTYNADTYCDECVLGELRADHIDGFAEQVLDLLARERGIDRYAEETFDSGDFPKVVFASQIEEPEHCGKCGRGLA